MIIMVTKQSFLHICVWMTVLCGCCAQPNKGEQPQVIKITIQSKPWRSSGRVQKDVTKTSSRDSVKPSVKQPRAQRFYNNLGVGSPLNVRREPEINLHGRWIVGRTQIAQQSLRRPPTKTFGRSPPARTAKQSFLSSRWVPQVKTRPSQVKLPKVPLTFDLRKPQKTDPSVGNPPKPRTQTNVKPSTPQLPQPPEIPPRAIDPPVRPRPSIPQKPIGFFGANYRPPFGVLQQDLFRPIDNDMQQNLNAQRRSQFKQATPPAHPPAAASLPPNSPAQATPDVRFNQQTPSSLDGNLFDLQTRGQNPNVGYQNNFMAQIPSLDNPLPMSMGRLAWLRAQTNNPWLFSGTGMQLPYPTFGGNDGFGEMPNGSGPGLPIPADRPASGVPQLPVPANQLPSNAKAGIVPDLTNNSNRLPVTPSIFSQQSGRLPGGMNLPRPFIMQGPVNAQNMQGATIQRPPTALGIPGLQNLANVNSSPSGNTSTDRPTLSASDRFRQQMLSMQLIRMSFYERACYRGGHPPEATGEPMSCNCYPGRECESQLFMYISPQTRRECGTRKTGYVCCCEEPRPVGTMRP